MNEPYWDPIILKKGGVFIDAGANVGGWTIPAARYYEQVVAFEANPNVASVLHKNVRANKSKRKYGYIRDLVSSDILVKNACNIRFRLKSNDLFIVSDCGNRPASHIRSSINEDSALLQDYRVPVWLVHLASAKG